MTSLVSTETIRDNAESLGIKLEDDIAQFLSSDVEYRIRQIITAAIEVMKQAGRTVLHNKDIETASRLLDIDPPLGYQSAQPLRWGEATLGAGQPLFYIEDEEVDFEKIINAPLPKVPREVAVTAHWTAIEGVQPLVPMNPSPAEARMNDLTPKGATTTHALGATGNSESSTVKPLAKHIISVELQMFFEKVTTAVTDPPNDQYREAALSALRSEPTIHQLLPYFVQYITERVTHDMKSDKKLMESMMDICEALFANETLYIDPYINSLCPPIITCMMAKQLGDNANDQLSTYGLRDKAASIIGTICKRFGESSHELKSRLARSFLKAFMDNTKPPAAWYGAILGLSNMGVIDAIKYLLLPNVKTFEEFIRDEINGDGPKKRESLRCLDAIVDALKKLKVEEVELLMDGGKKLDLDEEGLRKRLTDIIGTLAADRIMKLGDEKLEITSKSPDGETEKINKNNYIDANVPEQLEPKEIHESNRNNSTNPPLVEETLTKELTEESAEENPVEQEPVQEELTKEELTGQEKLVEPERFAEREESSEEMGNGDGHEDYEEIELEIPESNQDTDTASSLEHIEVQEQDLITTTDDQRIDHISEKRTRSALRKSPASQKVATKPQRETRSQTRAASAAVEGDVASKVETSKQTKLTRAVKYTVEPTAKPVANPIVGPAVKSEPSRTRAQKTPVAEVAAQDQQGPQTRKRKAAEAAEPEAVASPEPKKRKIGTRAQSKAQIPEAVTKQTRRNPVARCQASAAQPQTRTRKRTATPAVDSDIALPRPKKRKTETNAQPKDKASEAIAQPTKQKPTTEAQTTGAKAQTKRMPTATPDANPDAAVVLPPKKCKTETRTQLKAKPPKAATRLTRQNGRII
ncbi:hypothetical protein ABW20_dc0106716 [Dactylellina cionopaga]|nr:hypothetical protein ABW20_dc0106716 [Dactylellina cionopaga]